MLDDCATSSLRVRSWYGGIISIRQLNQVREISTAVAVHLLKTMYQILITGTLHIVQIDLIGLACQLNGNENTAHVS